MKQKLMDAKGYSHHALVFAAGDEFPGALERFLEEKEVKSGSFTGMGAVSEAVLAFFRADTKKYEDISVNEQVEIVSLVGNVSRFQGAVRIHAHSVASRADGTTIGGHLVRATVWPTLEVFLTAYSDELKREMDEQSSLPLISIP